ncbi:MAG: bifunctional D-glycero-beta-D-manno-heptose-7-phosphate kinase/D-glycero-beta-D-manno-heptose 1-phosphate adenylyltransferase HldE [Pseudomonadota bacterium]
MRTDPIEPLPNAQPVHVLVVGDVMLDRYWQGPVARVSPEAPVPVINVQDIEERPGGAANVALNVASLGAKCTLVGFVGDDPAAEVLRERLQAAGVNCVFLPVEDWPTIVKLRLVAQQQQMLRADFEQPLPLIGTSERLAQLQNAVEKHLTDADFLILEDYDKGTLEEPQPLIFAAGKQSIPVLVDPKHKTFATYRGADYLKPNAVEFARAVAGAEATEVDAQQARELMQELNLKGLVVTAGSRGMHAFWDDENLYVPARPVDVYDVTGAGDTAAATLAVALAAGRSLADATLLANVAGAVAVSRSGTTPVTAPEVNQALTPHADGGVMTGAQVAQQVAKARALGQKVVFTNGCFDILHAGHVTYLEEAAALGDRLVVAVNDDAGVTALKGSGRPVMGLAARCRVLLGLGCVDWVVSFSEPTPEQLLRDLQPDVLVKGGDYAEDEVVGAELVRAYGGDVKVLSLVDNLSTTGIVDHIKQSSES